jgi:peptide/nickel transport system substrate-binding protein
MVIRDVPYIPLYNPTLVEGAHKARFTGWVEMLGGIGNTWSFCQLRPK